MVTKTTTKTTKRKRVPFGGHRSKLTVNDQDPNYHYRWINDTEDRISRALAAGYEFVKDDGLIEVGEKDVHSGSDSLDSRISKQLRNFTIYLMRIPMEFHKEDIAAKDAENDEIDKSIYLGGSDKVQKSYGLDVKYKNR